MNKRLLIFLLTFALILGLYLLPRLAPIRSAILDRVVAVANKQGFQLSFDESAGGLWSSLELKGVDLKGPGLELNIDQLKLRYAIFSLIKRELPLSVYLTDVTGKLNYKELKTPSGSGASAIKLNLKTLELNNASLDFEALPYTLPDFKLDHIAIKPDANFYNLDTRLSTPEGSLEAQGQVSLAPFQLNATVSRADTKIARRWWKGIEGGEASAKLVYDQKGLFIAGEIHKGAIRFFKEAATDIQGTFQYQDALVTTQLSGQTLGGQAKVDGLVDIPNRNWSAKANGDVGLAESLDWLSQNWLPKAAANLRVEGRSEATLSASGWGRINLEGSSLSLGSGTLLGYPLDDLSSQFSYHAGEGFRLTASSLFAKGPISASFEPQEAGFIVKAEGQGLELLAQSQSNAQFVLERSSGELSASGKLKSKLNRFDREIQSTVQTTLIPEGWQFQLDATDSLNEAIAGTFLLSEGDLTGKAQLDNLVIPQLNEPVSLNLETAGPLRSLNLAAKLNAPETLSLAKTNLSLNDNFSGTISATLTNFSKLDTLLISLGPLSASGQAQLNKPELALNYALKETPVSGVLTTQLSASSGILSLQDGQLVTSAGLELKNPSASAISLDLLTGSFEAAYHQAWSATLTTDQGLKANYLKDLLTADFNQTAITAFNEDLSISGQASVKVTDLSNSLVLDLKALHELGSLELSKNGELYQANLNYDDGKLNATLDASYTPKTEGLEFEGKLLDIPVKGAGQVNNKALDLALIFDETLQGKLTGPPLDPRLKLTGPLDIRALAERYQLPVTGTLTTDLSLSREGAFGTAALEGEVSTLPVSLVASVNGWEASLLGSAMVYGVTADISGTLYPTLELSASTTYGKLNAVQTDNDILFTGSGELPSFSRFAWTLDQQAWSLKGSLNEKSADIRLGDSDFKASLDSDGWAVTGKVVETVSNGDSSLQIDASVQASKLNLKGNLEGTLLLNDANGVTPFALNGNLDALNLSGNLAMISATELAHLPLGLKGQLELNAQLKPLERSYSATAQWLVENTQTLDLKLEGENTAFVATASSDSLKASYQAGQLSLSAKAFSPNPYLKTSFPDINLSGDLAHSIETGWQGSLVVTSLEPDFSGSLIGNGEQLNLSGTLAAAGLSAKLTGELLPQLQLLVSSQIANYADLSGTLSGSFSAPDFQGRVQTKAQSLARPSLYLAEQTIDLSGSFNSGLNLNLTSPVIQANLSKEGWQGSLNLPLMIEGETHYLSGTLSGAQNQPLLNARLEGPYVVGPLNLSQTGLDSTLELSILPFLKDVSALNTEPLSEALATLTLTAKPDLSWQGFIQASAFYKDLPLELKAKGSGQGRNVELSGSAFIKDQEVPLSLSSSPDASRLHLRLDGFDLAALDQLNPVKSTGTLTGEINWNNAQASPLSGALDFQGELASIPLSLNASYQKKTLSVAANLDNATIKLNSQNFQQFQFSALSSREDIPANLTGQLSLGDVWQLTSSGTLLGESLELTGFYNVQAAQANWQGKLDGANLLGSYEGKKLSAQLSKPAGLLGDFPLELAASLDTQNGLILENLSATSEYRNQPLSVSASGSLYPMVQVSGLAKLGNYGFPLLASTTESGITTSLSYETLELQALFSSAFAFQEARLTGQLDLKQVLKQGLEQTFFTNQNLMAQFDSSLAWTADSGFSGNAELQAQAKSGSADLNLRGSGNLAIIGTVSALDKLYANINASLPQNPLKALSGQVQLESDLSQFLPTLIKTRLEPGSTEALNADLTLGGSLVSPKLSGTLKLEGLASASGKLEANLQGATVALTGSSLTGTASLSREAWELNLSANKQDLSALNLVRNLNLSTQLYAKQNWGTPLSLSLEKLELRSLSSSLKGSVNLAETWQGQLDANLSLADIETLDLKGGVKGSIFLSSSSTEPPQLSANLSFSNLGIDGSNAILNGNGIVTGSLFAPSLTLRLEGSGTASGQVLALLEPSKKRYSLSSNLKLAGFQSNLDLLAEAGIWQGSGGLSYRDFGFELIDESRNGLIEFSGRGALNNWSIGINLEKQNLSLTGNLNSLSSSAAGQLALKANWAAQTKSPLSASLTRLSLFKQTLGDISLELDSWQERHLSLKGENLQAQVSLNPVSWQLDTLNLPLGRSAQVAATGSGTLTDGALDLRLTSSLAGKTDQLAVSLGYKDKQLSLRADDAFLGGQVKLAASSPFTGNWQGDLNLSGLELYGAHLDLNGSLSGAFLNPKLEASTKTLITTIQLQGMLSATKKGLTFNQELSSPLLTEALIVTGQIAETSELKLSQGSETLGINLVDNQLLSEGSLSLESAGLRLKLQSLDNRLELDLASSQVPALALGFRLPENLSLGSLAQGLRLDVKEPSSGQLVFRSKPLELTLKALDWQTPYGELQLDGLLSRTENWQAALNGAISLATGLENRLPFLSSVTDQTFKLSLNNNSLLIEGQNPNSKTQLSANLSERTVALELNVAAETGSLQTSLSFNPAEGPRGTLETENLAVNLPGGTLKLNLNSDINPQRIFLKGSSELGQGQLSLDGTLGLASILPGYLAPLGLSSRNLSIRLGLLEIKDIPWISDRLPHLQGNLSGTATLRQNQLIAQLVSPDLAVEDNALPLSLTLTGPLDGLELTGSLARSRLTGTVSLSRAEGLFVLEQFPIQAPAEAFFGNTDVTGNLSGILRFDLPFGHLVDSDIRFASEQISLERKGIISSGDTSFSFINRRFTLDPTTFTGIGTWQGGGVIAENELNLNFSALQADFSPLLGLIPPLSPYEPEAFGSVNLEARGSLREPIIQLSSPNFNLKLAGTQFELKNSLLALNNQSLKYQSSLTPVSPLTGALSLSGDGKLSFIPSFDADLRLNAAGSLTIPTIGQIDDFRAQVSFMPAQGWNLSSQGLLGNPFTLEGSLRPLDLKLKGSNLNLRAPQYFLLESDTNLDLGFSYENRRFVIRGDVMSNQASLSGQERTPRQRSTKPRPKVLNLIDFDNVTLSAPRNMVFNATVGSAELGIDAVLSGTAASPQLTGEARSLRGSFRFAGRNFTLDEGIASFQPSRGIYPSLSIKAYSRFEKSSVTRGSNISFIEPAGPTFDVVLTLTGEVVPLSTGQRSFRIDLEPQLSSTAIVQFEDGIRAITQNELYSLLTLGRIEANAALTGEGSVAESVTQSAIDTAIDTFLLSELQKQLADALNLDVFEIRTTPLSSLITGTEDTFGVALKVGSYLTDEVFASYEISSLDNDPNILLSNEFNLRYQLAPLELGLTGRLKLLNDAQINTIPELGISISYAITPLIRLELGADVSNAEQRFSFGVSFRW